MDQVKYRSHLSELYAMSHRLEDIPVHEMIVSAERAMSLGPVVDPTLYMKKSDALREDMEIMRSFMVVKEAMNKMAESRMREDNR